MSRRLPVRWVTLAEAVAIAAVAVSALSLYNGWRKEEPAPVAAPAAKPLTLRAAADRDGATLRLSPVSDVQVVQSQRVSFPKALGIAAVDTAGDPRIEAGWLGALEKGGETKGAGDRRLPVLIVTSYVEEGETRTDSSVYAIGYAVEGGGLFGGRRVRLHGLSLVARGVRDGQRRVDGMWRPPAAE